MRKTVMELIKRGVVLTLLFALGSANATTWYVDAATGSSSHSGKSMSDAFKEIQTAIDKAKINDLIFVNDGVYSPISTDAKPLMIKSVNGSETTVIDGGGRKRCATLAKTDFSWKITYTNSCLEGFTLRNGYVGENDNQGGGGVLGGHVIKCDIKNNRAKCRGGGASISFLEGCVIEDNVCDYSGGGVYNGINICCIIRNNEAMDGGGCLGSDSYSCLIIGNRAARTGGGDDCGLLHNCLISQNTAPDGAGTTQGKLTGCILWKNYKTGSTTLSNYITQSIYRLNDVESKFYFCCVSPLPSFGFGNLDADPLFVDEKGGDFHLQSNSPCIDSGFNVEDLDLQSGEDYFIPAHDDLDGSPRIMGRKVDIGPYEFRGAASARLPRTWFVANDGIDLNVGCDEVAPFREIYMAISFSCNGDRILVRDGTYSPIMTMNKEILIESVNGAKATTIDGKNVSRCVDSEKYYANRTEIQGFTIRNGFLNKDININDRAGAGAKGGVFRNCIFRDNVSTGDGGGVYDAYLFNCIVTANEAKGNGGGAYCCRVHNCTVVGNRAGCGGGCYYGVNYNSIVYGNSANSHRDTEQGRFCCVGSVVDGQGNVVADPRFVDESGGDYRIKDSSPCINAGSEAYLNLTIGGDYGVGKYDFDGNPRIKGKVIDMGAFENQTAYPGAEVGDASAQQRYPWNGLVDVQFDVFGMVSNEVTNVVLSASGDVVKDLAMATFTQGDVSGLSNGTWHCVWDAGTDVPRVLESNLVVKVALPDGDRCFAKATKLDTRSQPRDAAGSEDLLVSAAWQDEVPSENVTATLTQTPPGYRATKLAEFTGDAVQKVTWDAADAAVSGVHLFTLTLKENDTGRVLKTMTSSFNVAGEGSEPQPVFTDDPLTIPMEFSSWSALSTFLNDSRAAFLRVNGMTAVPPTTNVVMISLGEFAVPLSMLSGTAEPVEAIEEYGVRVYHLHVREMGDGTSDLVATVGGVPVTLLSMPPYNPDRWVEALYGMPPACLTGEERAKWYAERDVARIEWFMTLVPQSDIATYRANRAAAVSEAMKEQPEIGIGGLATKTDGETLHSVTVNVKEDSVVDVFGKRSLMETNWTYAGRAFIPAGESAVGVVSDSLSYFMTVVRVAGVAEGGGAVVTEGDSDHDGIPDSVEKMTYGTNPHSADTSGGGIPDWTKIYVYGLNPLVTDTDGDGYDDIEELMSGTDPKVPLPGANSSIRYYYDEDDQLIRVHCGANGAMSAAELTPNGNPKTVKERRATK